jgi:hypothetical protein
MTSKQIKLKNSSASFWRISAKTGTFYLLTFIYLRSLSRLTSFQIVYSISYFSIVSSILNYFLIFTSVTIGQVLLSNAADGGKHREFVIAIPQNRGLDKLAPPSRDLPLVSPEW